MYIDMIKIKQNSKRIQTNTIKNFKKTIIASFFIILFVMCIFSSITTVTAMPEGGMPIVLIEPETITLNIDDTQQFAVIGISEGREMIWSVDDESVGIIDENGLFTANAIGTATVAVSVIIPGMPMTIDRIATVIVKEPIAEIEQIAEIEPLSITITPTATTIDINTAKQFTATILPNNANQNVIWSADKGAIDANGLFMANEIGNVIITATSVANEDIIGTTTVMVGDTVVEPITPKESDDEKSIPMTDAVISVIVIGIIGSAYMFFKNK